VVACVVVVAAQATSMSAQGGVRWLEEEWDFGVFHEEEGKVTHVFRYVNEGDTVVAVRRVRVGCGCTAVDFSRELVARGDTGAVAVTYTPTGRPGEFEKSVFVYFGSGGGERAELKVRGNVIVSAEALDAQYPVNVGGLRLSGRLLSFYEVKRTGTKNVFMRCYNGSSDTLAVGVLRTPSHVLSALVPDTVLPGRVSTLSVTYVGRNAPLWGLNVDSVWVGVRRDGRVDSALVEVRANVVEDFSGLSEEERARAPHLESAVVDEGRLSFGVVSGDEVVSRTFTLRNTGKEALQLRRVWVPEGEGLSVSVDRMVVKRGKEATVTVTLDPSVAGEGLGESELVLQSNDPTRGVVKVRVAWLVRS